MEDLLRDYLPIIIFLGIAIALGLALMLSGLIVDLAGSSLFGLLALTALVSFFLGMGLPTSAAYLLLAVLVAPALTRMGMEPIVAHMFIFYFGVMSFLTPPVAVSSYVAAGLAQANMWKTSLLALRAAGVAFVLPFVWCYREELLMAGDPLSIAALSLSVLLALRIYAAASGRMGWALRLAYIALAMALILAPVLWSPLSPPALGVIALAGARLVWERLATPRESAA